MTSESQLRRAATSLALEVPLWPWHCGAGACRRRYERSRYPHLPLPVLAPTCTPSKAKPLSSSSGIVTSVIWHRSSKRGLIRANPRVPTIKLSARRPRALVQQPGQSGCHSGFHFGRAA